MYRGFNVLKCDNIEKIRFKYYCYFICYMKVEVGTYVEMIWRC